MSASKGESPFLDEFKKFIGFMQNLWAILAGVSVLFPLSNVLVQAVPLAQWNQGGLTYLSPQLVTVLSTLACLFVILWTFGRRDQFARQRQRRAIQRQAVRSFALGVAAVIVYLGVHYAVVSDFYFLVLGWQSGDPRRMVGDLVLLLTYSAFFVFTTRAFMLLGMMEYFGQPERSKGSDGGGV